jgi:hypothetical protein
VQWPKVNLPQRSKLNGILHFYPIPQRENANAGSVV